MKAVILAGGYGTRILEETSSKPKPMILIGGHPLIWHLMKIFSSAGINDFVICSGFKSEVIKRYFLDYHLVNSDFSIALGNGNVEILNSPPENWNVTVVDTGLQAQTGERIRQILPYVGNEFIVAYGDTLADINLKSLVDFHRSSTKDITVTVATQPTAFGMISVGSDHSVTKFTEKPEDTMSFVNRGFFVVNRECLDTYSWGQNQSWEFDVFSEFVHQGRVAGYRHLGFVQSMDTLKERNMLEELWETGAPWKTW